LQTANEKLWNELAKLKISQVCMFNEKWSCFAIDFRNKKMVIFGTRSLKNPISIVFTFYCPYPCSKYIVSLSLYLAETWRESFNYYRRSVRNIQIGGGKFGKSKNLWGQKNRLLMHGPHNKWLMEDWN
jgi:hypothetical protein